MKTSTISDEELARRAQSGCRESFDLLLRRFQTPVLHFLERRGFAAEAEDLTQETFLRVYENLAAFRPHGTFSAWLFTIARHVAINHYRREHAATRAVTFETTTPDETEAGGVAPLDAMVAEENRNQLWDLAARVLPEEQWTALWLLYAEDMSTRDIAAVLHRSRAAVKILLFRARKILTPLVERLDSFEQVKTFQREFSLPRNAEEPQPPIATVLE